MLESVKEMVVNKIVEDRAQIATLEEQIRIKTEKLALKRQEVEVHLKALEKDLAELERLTKASSQVHQ